MIKVLIDRLARNESPDDRRRRRRRKGMLLTAFP
jgi:hypothetical protein